MEQVTFFDSKNPDGTISEHALIDRGDGSYTSMTKAHYEAQQVEHLTEIVTN